MHRMQYSGADSDAPRGSMFPIETSPGPNPVLTSYAPNMPPATSNQAGWMPQGHLEIPGVNYAAQSPVWLENNARLIQENEQLHMQLRTKNAKIVDLEEQVQHLLEGIHHHDRAKKLEDVLVKCTSELQTVTGFGEAAPKNPTDIVSSGYWDRLLHHLQMRLPGEGANGGIADHDMEEQVDCQKLSDALDSSSVSRSYDHGQHQLSHQDHRFIPTVLKPKLGKPLKASVAGRNPRPYFSFPVNFKKPKHQQGVIGYPSLEMPQNATMNDSEPGDSPNNPPSHCTFNTYEELLPD